MTTQQWANNQGNADTHIFRYKKEYGDNPGSTKSATEANKPSSWLHFTRGVVGNNANLLGDTQKSFKLKQTKRQDQTKQHPEYLEKMLKNIFIDNGKLKELKTILIKL